MAITDKQRHDYKTIHANPPMTRRDFVFAPNGTRFKTAEELTDSELEQADRQFTRQKDAWCRTYPEWTRAAHFVLKQELKLRQEKK